MSAGLLHGPKTRTWAAPSPSCQRHARAAALESSSPAAAAGHRMSWRSIDAGAGCADDLAIARELFLDVRAEGLRRHAARRRYELAQAGLDLVGRQHCEDMLVN